MTAALIVSVAFVAFALHVHQRDRRWRDRRSVFYGNNRGHDSFDRLVREGGQTAVPGETTEPGGLLAPTPPASPTSPAFADQSDDA